VIRFRNFIGTFFSPTMSSSYLGMNGTRWKHAATCHHDSTLRGEGDYFEQDDVYNKLLSFEQLDDDA